MNITILGVAVLLTTGLVQVLKDAANINTRYAPLASVIIGVGIAALEIHPFNAAAIIIGLTIGLTACGLYSGVSTTVQGNTPPETTIPTAD